MPILHVTSPNGNKKSFDESEFKQVRFGRDVNWAHIVLDESLAGVGVGREHCELVASAGCYSLEMNGHNQVWVNGKLAYDGDILKRQCSISFIKNSHEATYQLETELSGGALTADMGSVVTKGSRFNKLIIIILILMTLIIGFIFLSQKNTVLPEHQIEHIKNRVFSVQTEINGKASHAGTAWIAYKNTVVTNRHVAEFVQKNIEYQEMGLEASSYIRFRSIDNQQGKIMIIKNVIFHPAEKAYKEYLNQFPARTDNGFSLDLDVYDIAILELEDESIQLDPLELATEQDVQNLKSGDPLLLVGFPLNPSGNAWNILAPVAETSHGKFDKTRNAFSSEGLPEINPLISYDITTSGGNSGSPVVNSEGKVIAIHFAGSKVLIEGTKVAGKNKAIRLDAGGKSYGQHVRLVNQLVDGSIFHPTTLKKEKIFWEQWLTTSTSIEESQVIAKNNSTDLKNQCLYTHQAKLDSLDSVSPNRGRSSIEVPLPVIGEYLIFIQSLDPSGEKIDVSAHDEFGSYNYNGKKHNFDFETKTVENNQTLNITLGAIKSQYNYTVKVYNWSNENCQTDKYLKL